MRTIDLDNISESQYGQHYFELFDLLRVVRGSAIAIADFTLENPGKSAPDNLIEEYKVAKENYEAQEVKFLDEPQELHAA